MRPSPEDSAAHLALWRGARTILSPWEKGTRGRADEKAGTPASPTSGKELSGAPDCALDRSREVLSRCVDMTTSKLFIALALGVSIPGTSWAGDGRAQEKWISLFNGQDLTGWVTAHEAQFVVTNGVLRLVTGMGWLRTDRMFRDFVWEAEWRALEADYDSGLFVRAGLEGKPWPKDAWQVNLKANALGGLVKGFRTVVPAETPRMPVDRWVKFRLEVRGRKITLDVYGERAWEFDQLDAAEGYLGIQAENKAFEFRHLRVRELPSDG